MKKIIALVAAAALCASAVFAENTIYLGLQFPSANLSVSGFPTASEYTSRGNFFSSGAGGSLGYTHVAGSGFTFKLGAGLAGVGTSDIRTISGENMGGIELDLGLGFGGSFIHNERMTLSLTGDLGLRIKYLFKTDSDENGWINYDIYTEILSAMFYIGPELSYTFRFSEHVGMFVNLGYFYNIGNSNYAVRIDDDAPDSDDFTTSGFSFHPKFGLSLSF